ncbi:MAG: hypothetical protein WBA23_19445 [Tunicatimonas sp.]|uniref:hypothetical protein n=1 Tax=Tunicatimonas sp. TaxID=1940096 RepID=UPI003C71E14E
MKTDDTATIPTLYKFILDSLMLMEEVGLFSPDYRIELLYGEIIELSRGLLSRCLAPTGLEIPPKSVPPLLR